MAKDEKAKKPQKYKNKKPVIDGIKFDSKAEGEYYLFLKNAIKDSSGLPYKSFKLQPEYVLQDSFDTAWYGKIKAIKYKADFLIEFYSGYKVVVDIKGYSTPEALLKRKLFLKKYPELELVWLSKSIKYGDSDGFINYFKLQKIRRENKKKKDKQHSSI